MHSFDESGLEPLEEFWTRFRSGALLTENESVHRVAKLAYFFRVGSSPEALGQCEKSPFFLFLGLQACSTSSSNTRLSRKCFSRANFAPPAPPVEREESRCAEPASLTA